MLLRLFPVHDVWELTNPESCHNKLKYSFGHNKQEFFELL